MPIITISGVPINFPDTAASPVWSQAVIQFAVLTAQALSSVVGSFDVLPQNFTLDSYNVASNIAITGLTFPVANVRAANIRYTVHRHTDTPNEVDEQGLIFIVYNNVNGTWDISQEKSGDANISFTISNTGQVSFTTTSVSGSNHVGFITYAAQSLLNP